MTAFAFGGLNGLSQLKSYAGMITLEPVCRRLAQAEAVLLQQTGERQALDSWLLDASTRLYDRERLHQVALAVIAIQVGVAESLAQVLGPPDWSAGISLGETSRTVFAGCGSLEAALVCAAGMVRRLPGLSGLGESVIAFLPREQPLSPADSFRLRACGVVCSRLSERMLNLAGSPRAMVELRSFAAAQGWKLKRLADFPTHTPLLEDHVLELQRGIRDGVRRPPRHRLLSSQGQRQLITVEDVRGDLSLLLTSPYDWCATVSTLVRDHGVRRLVNVGPCITLSVATRHLGLELDVLDAGELLQRSAL